MKAAGGEYNSWHVVNIEMTRALKPYASQGQTIGLIESISHDSHRTGPVIIPVYLVWEPCSRSEILEEAVNGIREIHILIPWVDGYIIQ